MVCSLCFDLPVWLFDWDLLLGTGSYLVAQAGLQLYTKATSVQKDSHPRVQ